MNSLIRDHLPATYFEEYQSLRPSLLEGLVDDDLGNRSRTAGRPGSDEPSMSDEIDLTMSHDSQSKPNGSSPAPSQGSSVAVNRAPADR